MFLKSSLFRPFVDAFAAPYSLLGDPSIADTEEEDEVSEVSPCTKCGLKYYEAKVTDIKVEFFVSKCSTKF